MSQFFEWDKSLDLGIGDMNDEHKHLIALMNRLFEEVRAKSSPETLTKSVGELISYTHQHFRDEEDYMGRVGYPKLETHKTIHMTLLSRLDNHAKAFAASGALGSDFFEFLQFWLAAHIRGIDMQYAEHVRAGKVA